MRALLLAGAAVVSLAGPSAVRAADIYYPPAPGYTQAPPAYEAPPAYYQAPPSYQPPPPDYGPPPPAYRPAPRYGYAPPPPQTAYGPPPVVAYDDDDDEVAPPRVYRDAPVYAQRPRYDCWWEWGQRRCAPRRGW
jgi:hypothetical protein